MTFLPIIQRELLSRSRSRATYWVRSGVGLLGVLVCLQSMGYQGPGGPPVMGRYVFNGILSAAFLVSCGVCFLTADAISAERREGTLSLLFLTRVRVIDVLLGKLGSVAVASACAVVAFLPVLMVPVLAGGVTGGEAFRKGLTLLSTLFLALVTGIAASASQHERFRALRRAVVLLVLVLVVPFLPFVVSGRWLPRHFGVFSPLVQMIAAGDLQYTAEPRFYWSSMAAVQLVAWSLLVWTGLRLRRALKEDEDSYLPPTPDPTKEAERALGLGSWQPVKDESSPVEWLVYRQFGISAGIWAVALLGLAGSNWATLTRPIVATMGPAAMLLWPLGVAGGLVGSALLAWVASRFFVRVRRSGDLELLLTTPLGAESIVSEQWRVLQRTFVWPVLVMQAPLLPQLLGAFGHAGGAALPSSPMPGLLFKVLCLANAFFGPSALCWLGLWLGLKAKSQAAAIMWTVGLGKFLPELNTLIFSALLAPMTTPAGRPGSFGMLDASWLPQAVNLALFLWLIKSARRALVTDLTEVDATPLNLRRAFLGNVA